MRGETQLACSKPVSLSLLQEWLQTAALAKRTRDASSMRARLSLCTQGFRGVGQGGRSPRISQSSPPGRPDTHTGRPDGPKVSPGLSAGGCRVKSGSGPLERSLPPGSGALVRSRTVANSDPWVMTLLTRRGMVRPKKVGVGWPARVVGMRSGPGYEFLRLL
jgi:hypothetical protein